jgi:hypothetical protein
VKPPLYLAWHLGFGDAVICNGMVRELCKVHETVTVPLWRHNALSVVEMFLDLIQAGRFQYVTFDYPDEAALFRYRDPWREQILNIGYAGENFEGQEDTFDRAFYRQAGMDFNVRWDSFKIPGIVEPLPLMTNGTSFVHDDPSRGFVVRRDLVGDIAVLHRTRIPLLELCLAIQFASEVHVIDSCCLHLAESIKTNGQLFWHKYARDEGPFSYVAKRKPWTVFEADSHRQSTNL